jgi:hypothetical protein
VHLDRRLPAQKGSTSTGPPIATLRRRRDEPRSGALAPTGSIPSLSPDCDRSELETGNDDDDDDDDDPLRNEMVVPVDAVVHEEDGV